MMKRAVRLPALLLLVLCKPASAQNTAPVYGLKERFISSAGISLPRANRDHRDEQYYGLCFSPSLNLLNKFSDFSVAIGSHIGASWHFSSANDPQDYAMLSLPAFLKFNIGHLATHNFYSSFGFSVGGGYNFSFINSDFEPGALLITEIHFWFLKRSWTLGYMQSHFQNRHTLMHEVSLQVNIGAYLRDARNNNKISKFVKPFRK